MEAVQPLASFGVEHLQRLHSLMHMSTECGGRGEVALWVLCVDPHGEGPLTHMCHFANYGVICDDPLSLSDGRWAFAQQGFFIPLEMQKQVMGALSYPPSEGRGVVIRQAQCNELHHLFRCVPPFLISPPEVSKGGDI